MTGQVLSGGLAACTVTAIVAVIADCIAGGRPSRTNEERSNPPAGSTAHLRRLWTVRSAVIAACAVTSAALVYTRLGWTPPLPAACCLCAAGAPLAASDLAGHRLPDTLTLPAIALTTVLLTTASWWADDYAALGRAGVGAAAATAFFLALALITGQVGGGDIKLAPLVAMLPAWLGWEYFAFGLLTGLLLAAITAAVLIAAHHLSRHAPLPLGPFLLAGALLAVLA